MSQLPDTVQSAADIAALPEEPSARLEAIMERLKDRTIEPQIRFDLGHEGHALADGLGHPDLAARCLREQAFASQLLGNLSAALELLQQGIEVQERVEKNKEFGQSLLMLASVYLQNGQAVEAMPYAQQGLELSKFLGDRTLESNTLKVTSMLYQHVGDSDKAIASILRALAIDEEEGDQRGVAATCLALSVTLGELGDYERSLDFAQRSLEFLRDSGELHEITCLSVIGEIYRELGDYTQSLATHLHVLDLVESGTHARIKSASAYECLGRLYLDMGDLEQASDALHRSLERRIGIENLYSALDIQLLLSKLYLRQGEWEKSFEALTRASDHAAEQGHPTERSEIHEIFSEYYEQQGDTASALRHHKEHARIDAEIAKGETKTKLERMQAQLELEKQSALTRLKAERMEHELGLARTVQLSLLPSHPPVIPGLDIASTCIPALEVGGDYYDFFPLGDRAFVMAIGDITGKGMGAAIHMTLVKGMLRAFAASNTSPKDLLVSVNRHVHDTFSRGWFASMIYLVIDLEAMELRFASAGHNPPLLLRDGECVSPERTAGMALGLTGEEKFRSTLAEYTIPLRSGDTLVVYTDGFSEAMNTAKEEYGEDALIASARRYSVLPDAAAIIEAIEKDVSNFTGPVPRHDDMTMVAVKVKYEDPAEGGS